MLPKEEMEQANCHQTLKKQTEDRAIVTARGYVGGRAWCEKLWDMNIMYKTRTKEEVTTGAVHVVEDVAAGYGIWGRYDPPKH